MRRSIPAQRLWRWAIASLAIGSACAVVPVANSAPASNAPVTIAILDTGVSSVPDLAGALLPGYNFVAGNTNTADDNGHGTEMASIVAGRVDTRVGVAGMCNRCSILPVKVLGADGAGSPATIALGIGWAAAHGAQVIDLSLNSNQDSPALDAAIAAAAAQGITVVIAAGNAGSSNPSSAGYPAASNPSAIRVAALNKKNKLFGWSNRGSWVDVAAPGTASAAMQNGTFFLGLQGTSVSSSIVAGLAGLMLSANGSLSPAAVKSLIVQTGTPLAGLNVSSGRRIDTAAAVLAARRA